MDGDAVYKEVQYFRHPLLLLFLAGIFLVNLWGFVQQIILGQPWGDNPAPDWLVMVIFLLSGVLFPALMLSVHLTTEVRREGLVYRFFPFHLKERTIVWQDIAKHERITYRPFRDYGGWGIRYGHRGKAYNVSGDQGVLLTLKDGRGLLIGSRNAEALELAIGVAAKKTAQHQDAI